MSTKASNDDVNNILEEKIGIKEFEEIVNELETLKKEKLNVSVFNSEIKEIRQILDNKPNSIDVINALDTKSDKEEIYNSLKNKIDKKEINNLLKEKANKNEIDKINKLLDSKINKNEFQQLQNMNNILKDKVDNNEFNLISEAYQDMKIKMSQRIDDIDNDLDRLIESIKTQFQNVTEEINDIQKNKADNSVFGELNEKINNKVDNDIMQENLNQLKNNIFNSMNNFITDLEKNRNNFERKIIGNLDNVSKENQSLLENINIQNLTIKDLYDQKNNSISENELNVGFEKLSEITKNIQIENKEEIENMKIEIKKDMENLINIIDSKIDTNIVNDFFGKISNELDSKIDSSEYQENHEKLISDINNKIKEFYEDITKELSNKITQDEVKILLTDKMDKESYGQKLSLNNFQNLMAYIEEIKKELKEKIDINSFNRIVTQFNANFDNIKNDIKSKADSKEIEKILKNKANIEQVNKAFNEINNKLNEKTNNNDFTTAIDNQAIINDTLCNENCIGRWVWKSGKIKSSYSVPWESQSVNTSPDNFIWEKDKTYIMINEGGLYELIFGFYSDKKPNIQILINGEIIFNSQTNNSNSLLNNSNSLTNRKIIGTNLNGNITGISVIEFINLQNQSKLSVCYSGGFGTGFIGLKKL